MSIASRINAIEEHIGNAYDKLEDLGIDLSNVDKNINNIASKLEDIYNDYPKVTANNVTEASLSNTKAAKMGIDLKGNTSQGADPSSINPQDIHTVNGSNTIKIENKNLWNNELELGGYGDQGQKLTTKIFLVNTQKIRVLSNTTYTVSQKEHPIQYQVAFFEDNDFISKVYNANNLTTGYTNYTFTTPANCNGIYIMFRSTIEGIAGGTYDMTTSDITEVILQLGSTASTYIAHAEQNLPIDLASKNKFNKNANFDITNVPNTWTITPLETGVRVKSTYTAGSPVIRYRLLDMTNYVGKTVRVKSKITNSNTNTGQYIIDIRNYDGSSYINSTQQVTTESNTELSFVVPNITDERKYLMISLACKVVSGTSGGGSVDYENLIITIDNSDMTYDEYYNYELAKIGTAQDYFYKNEGKWYLHKEDENIDLTSLTWTQVATNLYRSTAITNIKVPASTSDVPNLLAEKYKARKQAGNFLNGEIAVMGGTYNGCLLVQDETGTPSGILKYELATPVNTEITQTTLINQLEAIRQAKSYNEQTNISQTNSDLPFILDIKALRGE